MKITTGETDFAVRFTAFDSDGAGVALTAASAGLEIYYNRLLKGVKVSTTMVWPLSVLASLESPHSDGGIIHLGDGLHRLDLPDAAWAAGADQVRLLITATDITGGIAHERLTVGAATASQASVDAVAEDVEANGTAIAALSGTELSVVSPVGTDGAVEAYRARDYANTDGLAFDWSNSAGTWPDLTGATINVRLGMPGRSTVALYEFDGSVITPTGAGQKVRLELTDADLSIRPDDYTYNVVATLASGRIINLYVGTWSVLFALEAPAA